VCSGRCDVVEAPEERHGVEAGGRLPESTQHTLLPFVVWTVVVVHHREHLKTGILGRKKVRSVWKVGEWSRKLKWQVGWDMLEMQMEKIKKQKRETRGGFDCVSALEFEAR
jgi:hypothetical protein